MNTKSEANPLRRVVQHVDGYRSWIIATALLSFVSFGAGIGLIAMSAYLISRSALLESTAALATIIVGVRFFAITRVVARYGERYIGHLGTFRFLTHIRVWCFRALIPVAPAALLGRASGDVLTTIISDVDTMQDLYLRVLVPPLAAVLTIATGCLVLSSFGVTFGIVLALFAGLCGVMLPLAIRRMTRLPSSALVASQAEVNTAVVECVSGIADLIAFGREDFFIDRVAAIDETQKTQRAKLANARGIAAAGNATIIGLAAITVSVLAIGFVDHGSLNGVSLALIPLVTIAAFEAIGPLSSSYEHLDRSKAAASRLVSLIDSGFEVPDPHEPHAFTIKRSTPISLTVTHLTFRYRSNDVPVFRNASFDIPAGSTVAVLGPSGAGKSTVVNVLSRYWDYEDGSIRLQGVELRDLSGDAARQAVAVVAQRDHIFDTTLRDNLLVGDGEAADDRLWAACDAADLGDVIRTFPIGLATRMGENGSRLSGGERQRLMIARALLADAPIMILDEATAHLDEPTQRRVLAGVREWRQGLTTIVIAHDVGAVPTFDFVLKVHDGIIEKLSDSDREGS